MGLGLNTGGNGADIVPHIRYDARAGRLLRAERSQGADGRWTTELVDISQPPPVFVMDLERIEVGWMAYGSGGPDLRMVPFGGALPPQPSPEHKQGFRVRVYAPKLLGGVREFASSAKAVIAAMDALHSAFEAAPERGAGAGAGGVPRRRDARDHRTPQGSSTNYAPGVPDREVGAATGGAGAGRGTPPRRGPAGCPPPAQARSAAARAGSGARARDGVLTPMPDASGGGGAFGLPRRRARLAAAGGAAADGRGPALGGLALDGAGEGGAKPDKPLFRAADPMRHASTQDPGTWGSFAAAMGAVAAGEADGAGYVLRDDAEHVFLDLDNCRDPATGAIADWAMRLVEECGSYAEATPSGRGLRIIGLNEGFRAPVHRAVAMPEGGRVEIYHRCPRYVTVSGRRLPEAPDELRPICDVAADLLLLAQPEGQGKPDAPPSPAPRSNPDASREPGGHRLGARRRSPTPTCPGRSGRGSAWRSWRASGGSDGRARRLARVVGQERQAPATRPATSAGGTGSAARPRASASPRCTASPAWPTRSGSSRRWCRACTAPRGHAERAQEAVRRTGRARCPTRRRRPPAPLLSRSRPRPSTPPSWPRSARANGSTATS